MHVLHLLLLLLLLELMVASTCEICPNHVGGRFDLAVLVQQIPGLVEPGRREVVVELPAHAPEDSKRWLNAAPGPCGRERMAGVGELEEPLLAVLGLVLLAITDVLVDNFDEARNQQTE